MEEARGDRARILETEMTVSLGISVNLDGSWVKTGHDIRVKVSSYPDEDMFVFVAKRMMNDAMLAAQDQIDILHSRVKGEFND